MRKPWPTSKQFTVRAVTVDAAPALPAHAVRWHCPRGADFLLQLWPDGAVVYDEASGDIHALSRMAGELLQQVLSVQQSGAHDLAQALLGEQPTAQDVCRVDELLQDFESLGFVEPCGP